MNDNREVLQISISKERNMFVAERFILNLVNMENIYPVSTDGGKWYPQAYGFLNCTITSIFHMRKVS